MSADLLRLLELAHPGRPQADLLAMIEATPNAPAKSAGKPVRTPVGARPRTAASVERRRSLASQGWFPPAIAARFTVGEQAALAVIAQEVARDGACELFNEKIAALAGVARSTVKRALKAAQGLGFIQIEERRLTAWRNDANVVTIIDAGWLLWLRMRRKGEGSRKGPAPNTKIQRRGFRDEDAALAPGETSKGEPPQGFTRPDTGQGGGLPARPGLDGGPTKAGLPGLYRRRM